MSHGYCPNCSEYVEFEESLLDCRTGMMGWGCPECNVGYTVGELRDKQEKMFGKPELSL